MFFVFPEMAHLPLLTRNLFAQNLFDQSRPSDHKDPRPEGDHPDSPDLFVYSGDLFGDLLADVPAHCWLP